MDTELLGEQTVREQSSKRSEPSWLLAARLEAFRHFESTPTPTWAAELSSIGVGDITGDRALPSGHLIDGNALPDTLGREGVLFADLHAAVAEYPEIVEPYLGSVVAASDDRFAALNATVWSAGSFLYVPPGVDVAVPIQAGTGIDGTPAGRFQRTLIIAEEGASVHYIQGCSAPVYTPDPLHAPVVEVVVKPGATVTCTTIQNWSSNVFNPVAKRAWVEADGHMTWVDGNIGSRLTVSHPEVWLVGPRASGEVLTVAYAGDGQNQNTGATIVHAASDTTSAVVSKAIAKDGGRSRCRGVVRVEEGADGCTGRVQSDALVLDDRSISEAYPQIEIGNADAQITQETSAQKLSDDQRFYLMTRGLSREQATGMIVNGFIEPVTRTLPMEYAVEWNRLIELHVEGSIG